MDVLITDVTEMGAGNYCVAGWDIDSKRMVRPLPNGRNWSAAIVEKHAIAPGKVVRADPQGTPNGIYPHLTEDTPIDPASIGISTKQFSDWLGALAPKVAIDLSTGFDGHLQWNSEWNGVRQGVHTQPGVRCPSLVGICIKKANLSFIELFDSLKATLDDGSHSYQLAASSKALKESWRKGGLVEVYNALPARNEFHVRVGLARPFRNPPKCFAMLNGVL